MTAPGSVSADLPDTGDRPAVLAFDHPGATDVALAGGKGSSLARMTLAGFDVPPGFTITADAFHRALGEPEALRAAAADADMARARDLVAAADPPRGPIAAQLSELPAGPVAVRSSACAEDSSDASYAGQQETFLDVEGLDDVVEAVRSCWMSFFSDRAVFYRRQKGSLSDVDMAVVVQRMVAARTAGVLFTVDPVHRRRDRLVVEAAHGLGEAVVSGEVTPDHYRLDRRGQVKDRHVVGDTPVLTDDELGRLATLGLEVAELYGCPQDIEWAFDHDDLHLLQARPITAL